jgi:glycopeptide antibiotics resistance protein
MNDDLVFVDELVSRIRWDATYAMWDNLVRKPMDGYLVDYQTRSLTLIPFADFSRNSLREMIFQFAVFVPFGLLL